MMRYALVISVADTSLEVSNEFMKELLEVSANGKASERHPLQAQESSDDCRLVYSLSDIPIQQA